MAKKLRDEDLVLNIIVNGDRSKKEIGQLERSIKDTNRELTQLEKKELQLRKSNKQNTAEYKAVTAAITQKNKALTLASGRLAQLKQGMDVNKMSVIDLRKEMTRLTKLRNIATPGTLEWKKHDQQLSKVVSRYRSLSTAAKSTGASLRGMSVGLTQSMGMLLPVTGQLGLIYGSFMALRDATKVVIEFDKANAQLAAVLGKTRDETKDLQKDAERLGSTTSKTASEVVSLQIAYSKLGFTQQEILNVTEPTLRLAEATLSDMGETATVVGATLRAFQMDSSQTQRVVDVMAKSFTSSALDMEKFSVAMALAAPVANTAGVSIENVTSMLGLLVDRGLDASTAGTSLRNVFLKLGEKGLTFEQAMTKINTATDKGAVAMDLFGTRGATTSVILAQNSEAIAELEEKLINAGGAAEDMGKKQLETLSGKLTLLRSAWEGFILSLENGEGVLSKFALGSISFFTSAINGLTTLSNRWDLLKNGIKGASDETIEFLFLVGETEKGNSIDELITNAFEGMSDEDIVTQYHKSLEIFKQTFKAEGESVEDILALWEHFYERKKGEYENDLKAAEDARIANEKAEEEAALIERERLRNQALERQKARDAELKKITEYRLKILNDSLSSVAQETQLYRERLEKAGLFGKKLNDLNADDREVFEILYRQHKANLAKIDADAISDEISKYEQSFDRQLQLLKTKHNQELQEFQGNKADREALIREQTRKEEELVKHNLIQLQSLIELTLDKGSWEGITADDILSDEEYNALKAKLEEIGLSLSEIGLSKKDQDKPNEKPKEKKLDVGRATDILGFSQDDWDAFFSKLDQTDAGLQKVSMAIGAISNAWKTHNEYVSEAEQRKLEQFQQNTETRRQALESQMNRELERAKSSAKQQEAIREKYNRRLGKLDADLDKKRAEFDYNEAKRAKENTMFEIVANTAAAIVAALPNVALSYIVGTLGAIQLAKVATTPLPQIPGRESGGFLVSRAQDRKMFRAQHSPDHRGYVDRPTIIAGESGREFVSSNSAYENPTVRPVLDLIDTAQRNGTISTINLERIMADREQIRGTLYGRQQGGYIAPPHDQGSSSKPDPEVKRLISENTRVNRALYNQLRKGVKVALLGEDGFTETNEKLDQINKNVNL